MRREAGVEARGMLARDERCGGGADRRTILRFRNAARAAAERLGARGGIGEQAREERGVGTIHLGGLLAEQALRARADALRLAAQGQEVEIGLEHLFVRPVRRKRLTRAHLTDLRAPVALARLREAGIEKGGELHRERRGAARAVACRPSCKARADRARDREPVDPAVRPETPVLGVHHRVADGGADVAERHPREAAAFEIDALAVEKLAVAIVEPGFAGAPVGADGGEVGHRG